MYRLHWGIMYTSMTDCNKTHECYTYVNFNEKKCRRDLELSMEMKWKWPTFFYLHEFSLLSLVSTCILFLCGTSANIFYRWGAHCTSLEWRDAGQEGDGAGVGTWRVRYYMRGGARAAIAHAHHTVDASRARETAQLPSETVVTRRTIAVLCT